jgi:hypothetical protein
MNYRNIELGLTTDVILQTIIKVLTIVDEAPVHLNSNVIDTN